MLTDIKNWWLKQPPDKVCALTEIGYMPDMDKLKESRIPWAYFMTWSKEFCFDGSYNTSEDTKKVYASDDHNQEVI